MGIDRTTEIDFYFEIDPNLTSQIEETHYRCSNTDCSKHYESRQHQWAKFCGDCGTHIESYQKTGKPRNIDAYDFCQEHFDGVEIVHNLTSEGYVPPNIWLYNLSTDWLKDYLPSGSTNDIFDDGGILPLNLDTESIMNRFLKEPEVALFLKIFEEQFGPNRITPRFGLIVRFN